MSIEYAVIHLQVGGDPIYVGVAHRSWFKRLQELFG